MWAPVLRLVSSDRIECSIHLELERGRICLVVSLRTRWRQVSKILNMAFKDPFAAYNPGTNLEAHLVCGQLRDAGIEAVVIEDVSTAGLWLGGTIAEIHKPQVWIERADIERARPILAAYERQANERRTGSQTGDETAAPIQVVCEECGHRSEFPANKRGSVENCPHCHAFVDVGEDDEFEDWAEPDGESAEEA